MSEQPRTVTPSIDSSDVDNAFDPERRQAQQDWSDYLSTRDANEEVGNEAGVESGFNSQSLMDAEARNEGSREDWNIVKLIQAGREARLRGDTTILGDIEDDIQEHLLSRVNDESSKFSGEDADFLLDKAMRTIYEDDASASEAAANTTEQQDGVESSAEVAQDVPKDILSQTLALIDQVNNMPTTPEAQAKLAEAQRIIQGIIGDIDSATASQEQPEQPEPPYSQGEIDALSNLADEIDPDNDEVDPDGAEAQPGGDESDSVGKEVELYRSAEIRKADVLKRCGEYLRSEDDPERVEMMKGLDDSRSDYLAVLAKAQKGHSLRRLKPTGNITQFLGRVFGENFMSKLNRPSQQETEAAQRYEEAYAKMDEQMKLFFHGQQELGNINETERNELYIESLSAQYLANVQEVAHLQKESSKKPMNKWLRRAGYVGAGVGAGLLTALGPLGWAAGAGLAAGGMGGLRVLANKRNANTVNEETGKLVVDEKANASAQRFIDGLARSGESDVNPDVSNITKAHDSEVNREVVANRDRLTRPAAIVLGAAAVARMGQEVFSGLQSAEFTGTTGEVPDIDQPGDGGRGPVDVIDDGPSSEGTYSPPADLDPGEGGEAISFPSEAYVESGSGEIRETQQVLEEVLGTDVSMEDAERVYNSVTENQGDIFVNDPNYIGPDNDVRIGAPGTYTFKDGIVSKMVEQYNILKS